MQFKVFTIICCLYVKHLKAIAAPLNCADSTCQSSNIANNSCDLACMSPFCSFDSNSTVQLGDCSTSCEKLNCQLSLLSDGKCDDSCNWKECGWDGGDCGYCARGCEESKVGDGTCDIECAGSECQFDGGDCSLVYVKQGAAGGDGSQAAPYGSLKEAVAGIVDDTSIILLLGLQHDLTESLTITKQILIEPARCLPNSSVPDCTDSNVNLNLQSHEFQINVQSKLYLKRISFNGDLSLKAGCNLDTCKYCPYIKEQSPGIWQNDRNKIIDLSDYAETALCQPNHARSFIVAFADSYVELESVIIQNFRQEYKSIIEIQKASVIMYDTNFTNIRNTPQSAVILNMGCELKPYYCGKFQYLKGQVSYLNNGFEIIEMIQSVFIYVKEMEYVEIRRVDFLNNTVVNQVQGYPLLFSNNCRQFKLVNIIIEVLYGAFINHEFLISLPVIFENGISKEHNLYHLYIEDLYISKAISTQTFFRRQFGPVSAPNVYIKGFTLEDLASSFSSVYLDDYNSTPHNLGQTIETQNPDGSTTINQIPAQTFIIQDIVLRRIAIKNASRFLVFWNQAYITIQNLRIENQNDTDYQNVNSYGIDILINDPQSYISLQIEDFEKSINFSIQISFFYSVEFIDLFFTNNTYNTSRAIFDIRVPTIVKIQNINFIQNVVYGAETTVFDISDLVQQFILELGTFKQNIFDSNNMKGIVYIQTTSYLTIDINEADFDNIELVSCSIINLNASAQLQIQNSVFKSSKTGANGFVLLFKGVVSSEQNGLVVKNCQFMSNIINTATIMIQVSSINSSPFRIQLINLTFTENTAQRATAIYISRNVSLTQDSQITDSVFKQNLSQNQGSIALMFTVGQILIRDCTFEHDSGKLGSSLYINTGQQALVLVKSSNFTANLSHYAIYIEGLTDFPSIQTSQCKFSGNQQGAVQIVHAEWTDNGSKFSLNTSEQNGIIDVINSGKVVISSGDFKDNQAKTQGGVMTLSGMSEFSCTNCEFIGNHAELQGGVGYIINNSLINLSDCNISRNSAGSRGSVLFISQNSKSTQTLTNCQITSNTVEIISTILIFESSVTLSHVLFQQNTHNDISAAINLYLSSLKITDSTFQNQNDGFIDAASNSLVTITRSTFTEGTCKQGCAFKIQLYSTCLIQESTFSGFTGHTGTAIYINQTCIVELQSVNIENVIAKYEGSVIYGFNSSVFIKLSIMQDFEQRAISGVFLSTLRLIDSEMRFGKSKDDGGAVYCYNCTEVEIKKVHFAEIGGLGNGGAVFLSGSSSDSISIVQSTFQSNSAVSGGAIAIYQQSAEVLESEFSGNSAILEGGGIYLSSGNQGPVFSVRSNVFKDNTASYNGGAVYWNDIQPEFQDNSFQANQAIYGNDLGSYPYKLVLFQDLQVKPYMDISEQPIAGEFDNIASGQSFPQNLQIALVDVQDQIIVSNSESTAQLSVEGTKGEFLSGDTTAIAVNGILDFANPFIITGAPGSQIHLFVTSKNLNYSPPRLQNTIPQIRLQINLRECISGEEEINNQCLYCPTNTYSLNPDEKCEDCKKEAICYGGNQIVPRKGYWRLSKTSDKFFKCPNSDACLGSPSDNIKLLGECEEGYTGNLCQVCQEDWTKITTNVCAKCPDPDSNLAIILGSCFALLLLIVFLIKSSINSVHAPKAITSIYLKLIANYVQIIAICSQYDLSWPNLATELFKAHRYTGNAAESILSVECMVNENSDWEPQYVKVVLVGILPLAIIILCIVVWAIIGVFTHSLGLIRGKTINSVGIIMFFMHPSITIIMFNMVTCRELDDGEWWVASNLEIQCWEGDYWFYFYGVIIPSIITWVFCTPCIALWYMIKNRNFLATAEFRLQLGFLLRGYKFKYYYWEFVILLRKVLIISLAAMLIRTPATIQALTLIVVLVSFMLLQLLKHPFVDSDLDNLESLSIVTATITIYCAVFFVYGNFDTSIDSLFFAIILVANIGFFAVWLRGFFIAFCHAIYEKVKFCYRIIARIEWISSSVGEAILRSRIIFREFAQQEELHGIEIGVDARRKYISKVSDDGSCNLNDFSRRVPNNSIDHLNSSSISVVRDDVDV